MSTFAGLLLFVVVLLSKKKTLIYSEQIFTFKKHFYSKCVLKWNKSVIVHCKYCYGLIKCIRSGWFAWAQRQPMVGCGCVCKCISTWSTFYQDIIYTKTKKSKGRLLGPSTHCTNLLLRAISSHKPTHHLPFTCCAWQEMWSDLLWKRFSLSAAIDRAVCWLLWDLFTQIIYSC